MSETIIRISELRKHFGDVKAVDGISFDIRRGEIFGLLGPNGAGKTTTIRMICGLLPPTSGRIQFSIPGLPENPLRTRIGICPQENVFWPRLTCREQMLFIGSMYGIPQKELQARSAELLSALGLDEKANAQAKDLSGGMKRRLNICLALIHDPDVIILDEPEAGLDPQSRIFVRDFIKRLAVQKTVILTTHNMDEAERLSDRVAIIDHGKLLLTDTPSNLKKSIGEGDLLEIILERDITGRVRDLMDMFTRRFEKVRLHESALFIHSKNLIEAVSDITNNINAYGLAIKKMTLRENTLEDVFIHLTGRKLRQ